LNEDGVILTTAERVSAGNYDYDEKPKALIRFARQGWEFPSEHDEDIPDHAIVAMFALAFAWRAMSSVLLDEGDGVKNLRIAEGLLNVAMAMVREPLAAKGEKFDNGSKGPRRDLLQRVIEKTVLDLRKKPGTFPTAKEVLERLPEGGKAKISKDSDGCIEWVNAQGKEKTTSFHSLQNRLTEIKKKI
jgi:hypothetical protein